MLKEIYHSDFSKGAETKHAPHLLQDGWSPDTVNFDLTDSVGSLKKRAGQATYVSTVGSGSSICGLTEFIDSSGSLHIVAAVNDFVYKVTAPSTWTQIFTSATMNGAETNFAQMDNLLIIVNANITTQKWSGSGSTSNLGGSPPANVKYAVVHGQRLWLFNSSAGKSRCHYSAQDDPEDWTTTGDTGAGYIDLAIDDGDQITGAASVGGALIVFKKRSTFYIYGYKPSNFVVKQVSNATGCVANRTIVSTDTQVIWLSTNGVYVTNPNINPVLASDAIQPSITAITDTAKGLACAGRLRNQYWLCYDSDANSVNDKAWVFDYVEGCWFQYDTIKASVFLTRRDETFFSGAHDSPIIRQHDTTNQDSGVAITATWKSKVFDDDSFIDDKALLDFWIYADAISGATLTVNLFLNGVQNADSFTVSLTADDPSSSGSTVMVPKNWTDSAANRNFQIKITDSISNSRSKIHAFSILYDRRERQN